MRDGFSNPLRVWLAGYAGGAADDSRSSYLQGAVSLPREEAGKVNVIDVLPLRLQSALVDGGALLRDRVDRGQIFAEPGAALARRDALGGAFLGELMDCGIAEGASNVAATAIWIASGRSVYTLPFRPESLWLRDALAELDMPGPWPVDVARLSSVANSAISWI